MLATQQVPRLNFLICTAKGGYAQEEWQFPSLTIPADPSHSWLTPVEPAKAVFGACFPRPVCMHLVQAQLQRLASAMAWGAS